ncbi:MAG: hypothetical protein MI723_12560, partial [Caulobacterales bacterium]|nr:hypothetical protein [Caulobacterales bacterium]
MASPDVAAFAAGLEPPDAAGLGEAVSLAGADTTAGLGSAGEGRPSSPVRAALGESVGDGAGRAAAGAGPAATGSAGRRA